MENKNVQNYITSAYDRWVKCAERYVRRSRLPINSSEVVNDILCTLLERDVDKIDRMMSRAVGKQTELDLFIMHIIRISIYSPRSPFRYQRGQHCTGRISSTMQIIDEASDSIDKDMHEHIWAELAKSDIPELSKRVFIWRYFDGNPISKWPGPENKRVLYRAYGRIFKRITTSLRRKIVL